jgi:hypothetical protein
MSFSPLTTFFFHARRRSRPTRVEVVEMPPRSQLLVLSKPVKTLPISMSRVLSLLRYVLLWFIIFSMRTASMCPLHTFFLSLGSTLPSVYLTSCHFTVFSFDNLLISSHMQSRSFQGRQFSSGAAADHVAPPSAMQPPHAPQQPAAAAAEIQNAPRIVGTVISYMVVSFPNLSLCKHRSR